MAVAGLPPKINTKNDPANSADEKILLRTLKGMLVDAERSKENYVGSETYEDNLNCYRGDLRPDDTDYDIFYLNIIKPFINNMVAALTDSRPGMDMEAIKPSLKPMSDVLAHLMPSLWNLNRIQPKLWKFAHTTGVFSHAAFYTGWNNVDRTIIADVIPGNRFSIDPIVIESSSLMFGKYVAIKRVATLDELRVMYKSRGILVKSDVSVVPKLQSDGGAGSRDSKGIIDSPSMTELIGGKSNRGSSLEALPRANVWEIYFIDHQYAAGGQERAFPTGRRVIMSEEIILDDGPNPFWDGEFPLDMFDWDTDPEHPYGQSAAQELRSLQTSFNELGDGTIQNHVDSNRLIFQAEYDAIDEKDWQSWAGNKRNIIARLRKRGSDMSIRVPPAFGADKIQMSERLLAWGRMISGISNLPENPGSLQTGPAIQGLQEGVSLPSRARAARFEDTMSRIGQKVIARTLQYVTSDEIINLLGESPETLAYAKLRADLFINDNGKEMTPFERRSIFRHLRFTVTPGSSSTEARQRRFQNAIVLHRLGALSLEEVMKLSDFMNPKEKMLAAKLERATGTLPHFPLPGQEPPDGKKKSSGGLGGPNPIASVDGEFSPSPSRTA